MPLRILPVIKYGMHDNLIIFNSREEKMRWIGSSRNGSFLIFPRAGNDCVGARLWKIMHRCGAQWARAVLQTIH